MFGSNAFGSTPSSGFGTATNTFGQPQQNQNNPFGASSAFGAKPAGSTFGTTTSFGQPQQPQQTGGLFGAQNTASSGGLFGGTNTTTPAFGGFGGSSAFKPNFGATATTTAAGGLFGAQQQTSTSTSLFGQPSTSNFGATNTGFGAATNTGFGGGFANPSAPTGTTIKFNAPSGSDTMMKSGVQTQISTRHQCITCMKEYENKSIEELRCEDYLAGRKGGGTGTVQPAAGGLFGSSTPTAQPTGGLFGASTTSTAAGGMFGQQQQQNKPLFGTSGFGNTATSAAPAFGGFGAQPAATNTGGLFGAPKPAFGATTTAAGGFGGFGATGTSTSTSLFGPSKPFGAAAPQPATAGGLFGATTNTGFGAAPATGGFGATNTGFGQPQQQSIGLFGANQQQKPAGFGAGFGAASTAAAPAFGGFGAATTAQSGGLFGQNPKPAFSGFGATSTAPTVGFSTNTGFGATSGGLFGNTQNKPAFSLGGTSTAAGTGFGAGFGTNTGTGLFGNNQAKPGGLFGSTTPGFGTASTGIGTGTGFGASTGFGATGGLNFGATQQQQQAAAAPQAPPNNIQQQLLSLAASPFGDNPLFKPLLADTGKRQEVLKPTNPAAQKALAASQYKVSPHRNIKVRAKPLDGSGSKSAMFDGLDDDYISNTTGDMFVPRSSCKKLVLRSKPADTSTSILSSTVSTTAPPDNNDQSLTVPLDESRLNVKKPDLPRLEPDINLSEVDESFAALNPRKAMPAPAQVDEEIAEHNEGENDDKDNSGPSCDSTIGTLPEEAHPAGVVLKRAGYYTIPPLADLKPDPDGACNVEGFTIGREGYGNIYFPGTIDIAGMNFDETVFFRHKEVIVYPDDNCKPPQGEGLNRKAQITLDKVWPVDKSNKSAIKSPERLQYMNYEEKLERASLRLGARFMEYRPETGSWVFKVDHFSKYGLDDSDEEEVVDNSKKLKTLQLEKRSMLDNNAKNIALSNAKEAVTTVKPVENQVIQPDRQEMVESDGVDSAASDEDMQDVSRQKWAGLRSALFAEAEEDADMGSSLARPVILQQRSAAAPRRNVIEDIANSVLGPPSKGLGGSFMMDTGVSSSLLRSQFASHSGDLTSTSFTGGTISQSSWTKPRQTKLPSYNLQAGYDRFLQLQSSGPIEKPRIFVPQHFDDTGPLSESFLSARQSQVADTGLYINATFRVGFGNNWMFASSGNTIDPLNLEKKLSGDVNIEALSITSCGAFDKDQVASLEDWFEVSLENSRCSLEGLDGPFYCPETHPDTLHKHGQEATRQLQHLETATKDFHNWMIETKNTWDLMLALWGRLEDEEEMEEVGETHSVTMARREAVSAWLEDVVGPSSRADLEKAVSKGDQPAKVAALLSGGSVDEACLAAQGAGDHRTALLLAQVGGGTSASRLAMQQLDSWTQVKTDQHIDEKRLALYSLAAGSPVWLSTNGAVNTCKSLDWKRAFAAHLWYLTHPLSSVSDALYHFEKAFLGTSAHGVYAAAPKPCYLEEDKPVVIAGVEPDSCLPQDVKYHLLKLYSDRSHSMEKMLNSSSHTPDQLDCRLSWFLGQVLTTLGYRHMTQAGQEQLDSAFASQLETVGLWHWGVFVLLHLEDGARRKAAVCSLLGRHVALDDGDEGEDDYNDREEFVVERLGVPRQWVAAAKAVLARARGRPRDRALHLIQAENWTEAHEVIVKEIAPDAIISQEYHYLQSLLSSLAPPDVSSMIPGWNSAGKVYYQFISVDESVTDLLERRDEASVGYDLERLRPDVSQLCRAVSKIPVTSCKERLAQSEIAKKVAHLMRAVMSLEGGGGTDASTARQLAENLSTLPLPEDYALQELRTLTRSYMIEIMES